MPRNIKSREAFFDGDDTKKWSGEAKRQMEVLPPGDKITPREWPYYDEWLKKLGVTGTAIDFGCGTALYRPLFSRMDYVGIDQNTDMITASKIRWKDSDKKETFCQAPLNDIISKYPELVGVGDAGLFVTVLQHNHYEVADEIMGQVNKILKPGAVLFLVEATYIERYYPDQTRLAGNFPDIEPDKLTSMVYGAAIYTEKGWRHFFDGHGFDVLDYDNGCGYVAKKR